MNINQYIVSYLFWIFHKMPVIINYLTRFIVGTLAIIGVMTIVSIWIIFSDSFYLLFNEDGNLFFTLTSYWFASMPIYLSVAFIFLTGAFVSWTFLQLYIMRYNKHIIRKSDEFIDFLLEDNRKLESKLDSWWSYVMDEGIDLDGVDFNDHSADVHKYVIHRCNFLHIDCVGGCDTCDHAINLELDLKKLIQNQWMDMLILGVDFDGN